ncbi:MAG: hypothetical protein J3K34DRAFT_230959 [Monoraphidium minutum]|nr:MAG: hypothetical protein J3K34DRAFT_230959 [Monoraphidium minutum]
MPLPRARRALLALLAAALLAAAPPRAAAQVVCFDYEAVLKKAEQPGGCESATITRDMLMSGPNKANFVVTFQTSATGVVLPGPVPVANGFPIPISFTFLVGFDYKITARDPVTNLQCVGNVKIKPCKPRPGPDRQRRWRPGRGVRRPSLSEPSHRRHGLPEAHDLRRYKRDRRACYDSQLGPAGPGPQASAALPRRGVGRRGAGDLPQRPFGGFGHLQGHGHRRDRGAAAGGRRLCLLLHRQAWGPLEQRHHRHPGRRFRGAPGGRALQGPARPRCHMRAKAERH